jgi:hypothetical protein
LSCGEPLEVWKHPLELDAYVPCLPCGRLFMVTDTGLEPVLLSLESPELRHVFDDLVAAWFSLEQRRQSTQYTLSAAA